LVSEVLDIAAFTECTIYCKDLIPFAQTEVLRVPVASAGSLLVQLSVSSAVDTLKTICLCF